jgi:hypothetical protein
LDDRIGYTSTFGLENFVPTKKKESEEAVNNSASDQFLRRL